MRDLAVCLIENLRAGGLIMRLTIGIVIVLIGIPIQIGLFFCHFTRFQNRAIRSFGWIGQDDLGTKDTENGQALRAGIRRDAKRDRDSKYRAESCILNAHVA